MDNKNTSFNTYLCNTFYLWGLDRYCGTENKTNTVSSLMDLTLIKVIIDCESCYKIYKQGKVTESSDKRKRPQPLSIDWLQQTSLRNDSGVTHKRATDHGGLSATFCTEGGGGGGNTDKVKDKGWGPKDQDFRRHVAIFISRVVVAVRAPPWGCFPGPVSLPITFVTFDILSQ